MIIKLKRPSQLKKHIQEVKKELKKLDLEYCSHYQSDWKSVNRKKTKDLHYDNISEKMIKKTPCIFICLNKNQKTKKICGKFPKRLIGCSYW